MKHVEVQTIENRSRQALTLSIVYSLLLLVWLTARLEYIEWNEGSLTDLMNQFLRALVLLQCYNSALLMINTHPVNWRQDLLAMGHVLLFPLPFYTFIWLTGSVPLIVLLKSLFLVGCFSGCSLIIQYYSGLIRLKSGFIQPASALAQTLLCVLLWNYRESCWGWLQI